MKRLKRKMRNFAKWWYRYRSGKPVRLSDAFTGNVFIDVGAGR